MNQVPLLSQSEAQIRERVFATADALYEQCNRAYFPKVDDVRRLCKADMNAVSKFMKEWRQAKTSQVIPVVVPVPESVQQAMSSATATVWQQATDLANKTLFSAQAGWDAERQENETMRAELSTSYDMQAADLEATKTQLIAITAELDEARRHHEATAVKSSEQFSEIQERLSVALAKMEIEEARRNEIELRVTDLKDTLADTKSSAATVQNQLTDRLNTALAELDQARKLAAASHENVAVEVAKRQQLEVQLENANSRNEKFIAELAEAKKEQELAIADVDLLKVQLSALTMKGV
jgi:chromosome segregation ATPase